MERKGVRKRFPTKPYGWLIGLFAACMTTMIGVFNGVDPLTIVLRSFVAGLAVGVTVSIGLVIIRMANVLNED